MLKLVNDSGIIAFGKHHPGPLEISGSERTETVFTGKGSGGGTESYRTQGKSQQAFGEPLSGGMKFSFHIERL